MLTGSVEFENSSSCGLWRTSHLACKRYRLLRIICSAYIAYKRFPVSLIKMVLLWIDVCPNHGLEDVDVKVNENRLRCKSCIYF